MYKAWREGHEARQPLGGKVGAGGTPLVHRRVPGERFDCRGYDDECDAPITMRVSDCDVKIGRVTCFFYVYVCVCVCVFFLSFVVCQCQIFHARKYQLVCGLFFFFERTDSTIYNT